jgi:chemotaxis regulatin CheY-phosphate phosphatase CheZ
VRTNREQLEAIMHKTEEVVARALSVVAASKALRERQEQQRREIYGRIELASLKKPYIPKGIQLPLRLQ